MAGAGVASLWSWSHRRSRGCGCASCNGSLYPLGRHPVPAGIGQEGATWSRPAWTRVLGHIWNEGQPLGHLAGGCPNLRPMRTAFCGSGAKRDFHPEGTKAPPPPTAVNAQSWATSHMRWESAGATALGREGASTTHSPSKGVTGAFGTPGQLGAWAGGRFQKTPCLPPLSPASPSQNSAQDRSRRFHSGSSLLLLWDASPPWLPSAFVHPLPLSAEGSTKWPPQPSAILCQAGGREGGRRETTAPACPAWPGRSPAPAPPSPGLGQAALDLAPADILAGRSGAPAPSQPRPGLAPPPAPAPSGRGCCRPEPRGAVIKAMLLGSLGPARTVLEKMLARLGVGCWTR